MKNSLISAVLRHPTSEVWKKRTDEFGAALRTFEKTSSESLQEVVRTLHFDTIKQMGGTVLATLNPGFVIYETDAVRMNDDILLYREWERSSLRLYQQIEPFRLHLVTDVILYPGDAEHENPTAGIVVETPRIPWAKTYMARSVMSDIEIVALPNNGNPYGE